MFKRVLIVDDVMLSIEMGKSALSRTDCEVLSATSGREALDIIRGKRPSLVVLDLYMPEMDGDECCRQIKSDPELQGTPVIMVSVEGDERDSGKCFDAGCDDYLAKPFREIDFLKKVEKHLDIHIREYARTPANLDVIFRSEGKEYKGFIHDLSEDGMFIRYDSPLSVGTDLEIVFYLSGSKVFVEVEGKVVRAVEEAVRYNPDVEPGMGIQFTRISSETREIVSGFISDQG